MNMLLMIIYVVLAWVATPFAMEFVNTQTMQNNNRIANKIKGWPAYLINVIVCAVVALVICFLPGGWPISLLGWFLLTCIVYFGNQFFFNTLVKPLMSHRE